MNFFPPANVSKRSSALGNGIDSPLVLGSVTVFPKIPFSSSLSSSSPKASLTAYGTDLGLKNFDFSPSHTLELCLKGFDGA